MTVKTDELDRLAIEVKPRGRVEVKPSDPELLKFSLDKSRAVPYRDIYVVELRVIG